MDDRAGATVRMSTTRWSPTLQNHGGERHNAIGPRNMAKGSGMGDLNVGLPEQHMVVGCD